MSQQKDTIEFNSSEISNINPLRIPELIWEYVRPYLEKYKVNFYAFGPSVEMTQPTIVWRIRRRVPGDKNRLRTSPRYLDERKTSDNVVEEIWQTKYTAIVEFMLYADSSSVLDDLAWDFENAVMETEGPIQSRYTGFHINFLAQEIDTFENERKPEFEKRILKFEVIIPVLYRKAFREIRNIQLELWGKHLAYLDAEFIYSGGLRTDFSLSSTQKIYKVIEIKRNIPGIGDIILQHGIDYLLKTDDSNGAVYIEWLEYGSVPEVDEAFWITYMISNIIDIVNEI